MTPQRQYPQSAYSPAVVVPPPTAAVVTPAAEGRDTLIKQTDALRLGVFLLLAVATGGAAAYALRADLGDLVWLAFAGVVLVIFSLFWGFDTLIRTGHFLKRIEIGGDVKRIREMNAVNAAQSEAIDLLWQAIYNLQDELAAARIFTVSDGKGNERAVPLVDRADSEARAWLRNTIFGPGPKMAGIYDSGQIRHAFPFGGDSEFAKQVRGRLMGAQLIAQADERSKNWFYIGPPKLDQALAALDRFKGRAVNMPK